jgi:hypothetical protein
MTEPLNEFEVALPNITPEIWNTYQDKEFIVDDPRWAWTPAAAAFAREVVQPAVQSELSHLREINSNLKAALETMSVLLEQDLALPAPEGTKGETYGRTA